MLIFETRIYSVSAYKRIRNLPKIYLVDTGLARNVSTVDNSRLLENAVFLELKRKGFEIFYSNKNGECDNRCHSILEMDPVPLYLTKWGFKMDRKGKIVSTTDLIIVSAAYKKASPLDRLYQNK